MKIAYRWPATTARFIDCNKLLDASEVTGCAYDSNLGVDVKRSGLKEFGM